MGILDSIGNAISSGINEFEQEVSNVAGQAVHTAENVEHQVVNQVNGAAGAVGSFINGIPGEINNLIHEGESAISGLPGFIGDIMGDIFSGRTAHAASAKPTPGYTPASGTGKAADPSDNFVPPSMDEATAMYILQQNFDRFDTAAGGPKDGLVSKSDLQAILADPQTTAQMKAAAQYLLKSPTGFNQAETSQNGGGCDGLIGKGDVQAMLDKAGYGGWLGALNAATKLGVNANKAAGEWTAHTAPKPPPASSSGSHNVHGSHPVDSTAKKTPASGTTKSEASPDAKSTPKADDKKSANAGNHMDANETPVDEDPVPSGSDFDPLDAVASKAQGDINSAMDEIRQAVKDGKDIDPKQLFLLEQQVQQAQQLMTLVSNIEKELHDMRMAVINNIR